MVGVRRAAAIRGVTAIADVRKVTMVFKQGVGYDPVKLIASVTGKAGLW
ncbi:MAG: hypothetical protein HC794_10225 [Nitrospiraceae bacterium]|nr:hypothetical protein [Nitrospiraceae bacterium]